MLVETERKTSRIFYGYIVVAAAVGIQLVAWGIWDAFGVFFRPFTDEFGWSRAAISGAASLSLLVYGLMSIVVGTLNDRF
ncbi:MAG: MFS transporter, partial [Chloroflexota bacterium]